MNTKQLIAQSVDKLTCSDTPKLDIEIILMHILCISKIQLMLNDYELTDDQLTIFKEMLEQRVNNKPIAYIINYKEFMGLDFYVDENVLIPRPDTEILVEKCIEVIKFNNLENFLEIGLGSGCISIAISKYTGVDGVGVDIFDENIKISSKNAKINGVNNLDFINSDVFQNVEGTFDLIVSNPPYIDIEDKSTMGNNVVDYEPHSALFADSQGLYFYDKISKEAGTYLNKGGYLAFEIGYNQKNDVTNMMKNNKFSDIICIKDLAGLDRVIIGKKEN